MAVEHLLNRSGELAIGVKGVERLANHLAELSLDRQPDLSLQSIHFPFEIAQHVRRPGRFVNAIGLRWVA
jgi:hypothetical protein